MSAAGKAAAQADTAQDNTLRDDAPAGDFASTLAAAKSADAAVADLMQAAVNEMDKIPELAAVRARQFAEGVRWLKDILEDAWAKPIPRDDVTLRLHADRIIAEGEAWNEVVALVETTLREAERDPGAAALKVDEMAQVTATVRRALEAHWSKERPCQH